MQTPEREATYERGSYAPEPTGWVGWIVFAGVMMIIAGTLSVIYGIVAVVNDNWAVFEHGDVVYLDVSQWGWIHIAVGAVVVLAGFGVFTGNVLARAVAIFVAAVLLIAQFLWLPLYPLWSIIVIALAAFVIWGLTAHGAEMRALR